jgi:hypothetical protein
MRRQMNVVAVPEIGVSFRMNAAASRTSRRA